MSDTTPDSAASTPDAPPSQGQRLLTEGLGTAILVFFGFFGALTAGNGLAYGLTLFALLVAFGRISGGHFNPATSVGAAMAGRMSWKETGLYAAAQVGGAIVAGIAILLVAVSNGSSYDVGEPLGAPAFGDQGGVDLMATLLLELIVAVVFVLLVLALTDKRVDNPLLAPLAIGLTYAGVAFVLIGISGSVVNPAVALSTVLFSGGDAILQAWLFVLVPLLGAALAGLLHPAVFGRDAEPVAGSGLQVSLGSGSTAPQGGLAHPGHAQQAYPQQSYPQEQPIIQDGWQWDPQAQQWIPAQQQTPPQPTQPTQPTQQGWTSSYDDGDAGTQIRPPQ
ncbi:MIP/aquaporin family protein [Nocardioides sp.]|uniref:MIP/aquaporin family protein n=1 Tax=Nocardioides sp. TaxID=35761 RepID=UPI002B26E8A3|nr:aquaporin [Nocardioides sp.]